MSFRIPLPNAPAGSVMEGMTQVNALRGDQLANQIKAIQAQYAPLTTQAEAASKLAYANLMGPQFLAKMAQNPDIMANLNEPQRRAMLGMIYGSGTAQQTGNAILRDLPGMQGMAPSVQTGNKLTNLLKNIVPGLAGPIQGISDLFAGGQQPTPQQMQAQTMGQPSMVSQMPFTPPMRPGEAITLQPDMTFTQPTSISPTVSDQRIPRDEDYFRRAGIEAGKKEAGKEAGTIRAKGIAELNDIAFDANTMQGTLDALSGIVNSPEFRQIRQIPIAGQHEIGWYEKFGTPAQKRMIGQFLAEQGQVVVNAAGQFKGAFRKGEQNLINSMKVNSNDMPEVASGKIQAMSLMNKMLSRRSALTAQLMEDQDMSKGKAMEIADKQVNGENLRDQIDNSIMISIRNKKTGERKTISLSEARKLGVPNV